MKKLIMPALAAGLAGGFAEVAWIALYSFFTSTSGVEVARQVTAAVYPAASGAPWEPWAGGAIHLALSAALGIAFAWALWSASARPPRTATIWASALVALSTVWAANFLFILPAIDSSLATLMPTGATLLSKILFGVAMAAVLQRHSSIQKGEMPCI